MTMIDNIKRDREEGTVGPWQRNDPEAFVQMSGAFSDIAVYAPGNLFPWRMAEVQGPTEEIEIANGRRIARVPDMEAALLAAIPALEAIATCKSHVEGDVVDIARKALDAYEKQMAKGDNG